MKTLESFLLGAVDPRGREWFLAARQEVEAGGAKALLERFPALARRVGRAAAGQGMHRRDMPRGPAACADLRVWRAADMAGLLLLEQAAPPDDVLLDLYRHGDLEERTILLRALVLLPLGGATVHLLNEVQRTNVESHFQAAVLDGNLPRRALEHQDFGRPGVHRLVLKAAFLGHPVERLLEIEECASQELSRMLQDLASEREAAGRAVWAGTNWLIACAPTHGTVARLLGGLEHGDDRQRLAAARGLLRLVREARGGRRELLGYLAERREREPRPAIRTLLAEAAQEVP